VKDRIEKLAEVLVRILNKYVENQKKPRHYGLKELLYPSEIHLIMLIGNNPDQGVTDLARAAGITKGAISQTAQRLADKGIITKERDSVSGTKVVLKLTNKGKIAYYSHQQMHAEVDRELIEFIENLNPSQYRTLHAFLSLVEEGIDKKSET
jgi:DNA-binding MarR family transcriptional regulator